MWPTSVAMPVAVTTSSPGAAGDLGVHVRHVDAVAERRRRAGDRLDALGDRQALAGQRRLLDLERRRRQQPAVGRDQVARLDVTMSPGHELLRRRSRRAAPSRRTLALTIIIFWSAATLASALPSWLQADHRVEHGQAAMSTTPVPTCSSGNRLTIAGDQQDELHRVAVLAQERLQARLLLRLGEPFGPNFCRRASASAVDRPRVGVDVRALEDLVRGQGVPVRALGRGGAGRRMLAGSVESRLPPLIATTEPSAHTAGRSAVITRCGRARSGRVDTGVARCAEARLAVVMSELAVEPTYPTADLDLDLRWWAAANYLTIGQIYLRDNALLREPLALDHVKPRLLGHWGTSPGLSMIYALLNRVIRETRRRLALRHRPRATAGPRSSPPAGSRARTREVYPHVTDDEDGIRTLFRQFSSPGGVPSHVSVQTPGSDPRGRRARLRARPRGRRGVRQPDLDRRVRRRRRRGRDRSARRRRGGCRRS